MHTMETPFRHHGEGSKRLFLTPLEVAGALGVDPRTVRRAVAEGQIPSIRTGNKILIPAAWLNEQARVDGDDAA